MALATTRAEMVSGERLIFLYITNKLQAVGFTSVCSMWCRGRGQSGAVISWYAAVRNEARARRMMLRGDDFWQFASNTGRLVEEQVLVWYGTGYNQLRICWQQKLAFSSY